MRASIGTRLEHLHLGGDEEVLAGEHRVEAGGADEPDELESLGDEVARVTLRRMLERQVEAEPGHGGRRRLRRPRGRLLAALPPAHRLERVAVLVDEEALVHRPVRRPADVERRLADVSEAVHLRGMKTTVAGASSISRSPS